MKKITIINGPNLNLLGQRETAIYGVGTLEDIENRLTTTANKVGFEIDFFQSNCEGKIVDFLHTVFKNQLNNSNLSSGIIINAGAFTHTSVAIRDALSALASIPIIELHISNIYKRESFRHYSYISNIATGVIAGLGTQGYDLALAYLIEFYNHSDR